MLHTEIAHGKVTVVIGVPGHWPDRASLLQAVMVHNDGRFLISDTILLDAETGHGFEIDIYPHDPDMVQAFKIAGSHWITQDILSQIKTHTQTVYVLGPGGNQDNAREMMQVANALLKAGGIATKVENSAKATSRDDWNQMTLGAGPLVLYDAFVVFVIDDNTVYSSGMQILGYHDAIITSDLPPEEAVALLDTFLKFLLVEQPALADGHSFSLSPDSGLSYRLEMEPCSTFPPGELDYNPFGVWRLFPESDPT